MSYNGDHKKKLKKNKKNVVVQEDIVDSVPDLIPEIPQTQMRALKITEIDLQKLFLANAPKKSKIAIYYGVKKNFLTFQTPYLKITENIKQIRDTVFWEFATDIFGNSKSRSKCFVEFIDSLEQYVIQKIKARPNAASMFKTSDVNFVNFIRSNKDLSKYIKWRFVKERVIFSDNKGRTYDPNNLKKDDFVQFIVQLGNVWFDEDEFGLVLEIQRVRVKPMKEKNKSLNKKNEYIFASESESSSGSDDIELGSIFATENKSSNKKFKFTDGEMILSTPKNVEKNKKKHISPMTDDNEIIAIKNKISFSEKPKSNSYNNKTGFITPSVKNPTKKERKNKIPSKKNIPESSSSDEFKLNQSSDSERGNNFLDDTDMLYHEK